MNEIAEKMVLEGLKTSWENFFIVLSNLKETIQMDNDKSIDKFWDFTKHLQKQFNEKKRTGEHPCGNCAGRRHPEGEFCGECPTRPSKRAFERG